MVAHQTVRDAGQNQKNGKRLWFGLQVKLSELCDKIIQMSLTLQIKIILEIIVKNCDLDIMKMKSNGTQTS